MTKASAGKYDFLFTPVKAPPIDGSRDFEEEQTKRIRQAVTIKTFEKGIVTSARASRFISQGSYLSHEDVKRRSSLASLILA
jgi:hypothetical protein